ncbi:signal peptidase I [Actinospica robiniae]|uniref:signal peptidase I n=1 Tax=Actinospica robiniae TaxID=304901 RepID=UPI00042A3CD3|nr:signal peptidase I [Actinospica robiniae]
MTVERPETGLSEAFDPDEGDGAGSSSFAYAASESENGAGPEPGGGEGGESGGEQGKHGGTRRPTSVLGWIVFPLAVLWRFLFPKTPRPFLVELPFLVVFALVLAFLIKTFLVQAFYIPSGSMQATLEPGDRVLVNRAAQWLGSEPSRGEVVVFKDPGDWLGDEGTPTSSNWLKSTLTWVGLLPADEGDLIKRVIGVGGDEVVCCTPSGQITVNGIPLSESSYLYPGDTPNAGWDKPFAITIPPGYLWVMGDHRSVSLDSRRHQDENHGLVPVANVVGRADVVVWPISHWKTLPIPSTFKQTGFSALAAPGLVPGAAFVGGLPFLARRGKRRRSAAKRSATS